MTSKYGMRTYNKDNCISFRKTKEMYGGLSNMAGGYVITINNNKILTSEAIYQACRYPDYPVIQEEILLQRSPMTAKMVSKKYLNHTRNDWNQVRVPIMEWCLRAKLVNNFLTFGELLKSTKDFDIVEESHKDQFWGARSINNTFVGVNALGRLLMKLRNDYISYEKYDLFVLEPLKIKNFYLYSTPIRPTKHRKSEQIFSNKQIDLLSSYQVRSNTSDNKK